jgi:CheY-like chemotaxis protein
MNAAQASGTGGHVYLSACRDDADFLIEVSDDGGGIPADLLPRIFEPFFTTKPAGQGTGLGLSVSLGIVQQHGGSIAAENRESELGTGASFSVRLPQTACSIGCSLPAARLAATSDAVDCRRVLIVDDESTIRAALGRFYSRKGWTVSEASDGAAALRRLVDHGESFDLVISDVKMPRVSGIELHAALGTARPDLLSRLVFCTGEIESRAVAAFVAESGCRVLLKPFDLRTLAEVSDQVAPRGTPQVGAASDN